MTKKQVIVLVIAILIVVTGVWDLIVTEGFIGMLKLFGRETLLSSTALLLAFGCLILIARVALPIQKVAIVVALIGLVMLLVEFSKVHLTAIEVDVLAVVLAVCFSITCSVKSSGKLRLWIGITIVLIIVTPSVASKMLTGSWLSPKILAVYIWSLVAALAIVGPYVVLGHLTRDTTKGEDETAV